MAAATHRHTEPGRDTAGRHHNHHHQAFQSAPSPRARAHGSPTRPSLPAARPDTLTPTPIRGDFIPLSSPSFTMASHRHQHEQSPDHAVTLHMSFTDSQMNLLADAISRPSSPEKGSRRGRLAGADGASTQRSHHRAYSEDDALAGMPKAATPSMSRRGAPRPAPPPPDFHGNVEACGQSPARRAGPIPPRQYPVRPMPPAPHHVREHSPARFAAGRFRYATDLGYEAHSADKAAPAAAMEDRHRPPTIAQRRGGPRPSVDTAAAQSRGSSSHRKTPIEIMQEPVTLEHSKSTKTTKMPQFGRDSARETSNPSPSIYSTEERQDDYESEYETMVAVSPPDLGDGPVIEHSGAVAQSLAEYEQLYSTHKSMQAYIDTDCGPGRPHILATDVQAYPRVYSPLTPFIETMEEKMPRHKVLIGERGWLENTARAAGGRGSGARSGQPQPPLQKRGIFESLKKAAKDVVERADLKGSAASRLGPWPQEAAREVPSGGGTRNRRAVSRLDISLDPREQSVFYCELEFLITTALDAYIVAQFNAGRLQAVMLNKVAEAWRQKGRPRVLGFRYDVETQLELVLLHLHDFKFYGVECTSPAAVTGVLEMVRADARAMRVRTFCQPDLVMAKQLLDAQKLFNILGCSESLQCQLHEVVRFFKLILAREKEAQNQHCRRLPPRAVVPFGPIQHRPEHCSSSYNASSVLDGRHGSHAADPQHVRQQPRDQPDNNDLYLHF